MKLDIIKKYTKLRSWYITVLKEKNNYKLSLKDKIIAIRNNFSSDLYHMYNLNKNNIKDYMSEYDRLLSREINGEYKIVLDNKILFNNFFGNFVNTPMISCIILDNYYTTDGKVLSDKEVLEILKKDKSVIKPISGTGGGQGVYCIEYNKNEDSYLINKEKKDTNQIIEFLKKSKNCIITKFVSQHEYSSKIWKDSTNTIRIITIKSPITNEFIIPMAVHRWGRKGSGVVDNASMGGFVTKINVESGILEETKTFSDLTSLDKHPDSYEQIKGVKIPNWEQITNKIKLVASQMPYIPFIAWDIVIKPDGDFCVIEGNASSGLNIFQIFGPIKDSKLGEFYKHYGIIK